MKYPLTMFILFTLIFLPSANLQASDKNIGTTGATFLKIGVGARALSLGGAYTSIGDNIEAIFYNPAGLNLTINQEISFMHLEHFADMRYEYFGYSKRLSPSKILAGSLSYLNMGKFTAWDKTGNEIGSFFAYNSLFNLTYAQNLTKNIFIGTNIKFIKQRLANYSSKSLALDFGFLGISDTEELRYGACLQNLGNKIKFDKLEDKLPLNWKLGISYKYLDEAMVTALDINIPYDHKINYHLGSEYSIGDILALRLGYQSGPAEYASGLGGGFGLKYQDFYLDYAFVPYSKELENSHYISFSYKFGPEVEEKAKQPKVKKYEDHKTSQDLLKEKPKEKNFLAKLFKKDLPPNPAKKIVPKKLEKDVSPEDSAKKRRISYPPKISKHYPNHEYEHFIKEYPSIRPYEIRKGKVLAPQKKYQEVKKTGFLDFENYINSDIFEEQKEFILREKRHLGTWTAKRKLSPKQISKKSSKEHFEPLREKEDFDSYNIYKKYSITPPSKYYREEKPTIDKDWQYYAYDPDTYEYFKKKYELKEDIYKSIYEEYQKPKTYTIDRPSEEIKKTPDSDIYEYFKKKYELEKDTYKPIYEEHPDLKTYSLEEPSKKEIKTPHLPPEEVIIKKEVKKERIEEKKPIPTPIKKEDISPEENIWKNISEEIIKELCK